MSITEIAWEVHRLPKAPRTITYYSVRVSPTEYLTANAQDGEWRWDIFTNRDQRGLAARRLDGGSRPTLKAAKAAALDAWNAREER